MRSVRDLIGTKFKKATFSDSYVTICGDKEALVENVSAVYECNEIMSRLKAGGNEIVIWGEGLKLENYINNSVIVSGRISSVEISSGNKASNSENKR